MAHRRPIGARLLRLPASAEWEPSSAARQDELVFLPPGYSADLPADCRTIALTSPTEHSKSSPRLSRLAPAIPFLVNVTQLETIGLPTTNGATIPQIDKRNASDPHQAVYTSDQLFRKVASRFLLNPHQQALSLCLQPAILEPLDHVLLRLSNCQGLPSTTLKEALLAALQPRTILRQADSLSLNCCSPNSGQALSQQPLTFTVLQTEPVLQGTFDPSKTKLTVIPEPDPASKLPDRLTPTSDQDLDSDYLDQLEIDPDFLAHSVLDEPLLAAAHHRHSVHVLPLPTPVPGPDGKEPDDDECQCVIQTADLVRIGARTQDWVLLVSLDKQSSDVPAKQRLLRIIASDDHSLFGPARSFGRGSDVPIILVPPVLLFNLLGVPSYAAASRALAHPPRLALAPARLDAHLPRPALLPVIRALTLARIASPQAALRAHQPAFLRGLRDHFERLPRTLLVGDTIAIAIDDGPARFADARREAHPEGQDDPEPETILPSALDARPTLPIYFKVTNLELGGLRDNSQIEHPARDYQPTSWPDALGNTIEDGGLGGIVDPKATKLVQTGLEHGHVPDVKSWLGIDDLSPLGDEMFSTTPATVERKMYEHVLAGTRADSGAYGLSLTMLVSGPRGCGKTSVARRAAAAAGCHLSELHGFDVLGESEARTGGTLRARFERALGAAPCVLVLRHVDALARRSQSLETGQEPAVVGLLAECFRDAQRAARKGQPVVVVGTTTDVEKLPLSVLALFKCQLAISAPSAGERQTILAELLRRDGIAPDVDLQMVARETAGLVAGDLVALVSRARAAAVRRVGYARALGPAGIQLMGCDMEQAIGGARAAYTASIGAPRIPRVEWEDIGGLAGVRGEIVSTVELPLAHPELFAAGLKRRSGLLLYGPPGTGKTLVAKAVATTCGLNFFSVKGPELLNMYIGESEANVRGVFERARGARPCVVFFDELDSVAPKRGNQGDSGGVMDRIVSQLLAELDGMAGPEGAGVVVIGATNRPDLLDPALLRPGRFDKMIFLGPARARAEKLEILRAVTRKFALKEELELEWVIDRLEEERGKTFTGADLHAVCVEAMMRAIGQRIERVERGEEAEEGGEVQVGKAEFLEAIRRAVPSISLNEMKHYETIRKRFGGASGADRSGGVNGLGEHGGSGGAGRSEDKKGKAREVC